ncbi:TRAP transporter large permease subunit [bacterium]|nr:TRAP transporter large permease subunit [bacterium]
MEVSAAAANPTVSDTPNTSSTPSRITTSLIALAVMAMVLIPLIEAFGRRLIGFGVPGAAGWVQHLTLWLGLAGAILATLRGRHLAIATTEFLKIDRMAPFLNFVKGLGSAAILSSLTYASWVLVQSQIGSPEALGGWFPVWVAQLAMPIAFVTMALCVTLKTADKWLARALLLGSAISLGPLLSLLPPSFQSQLASPGVVIIIALGLIGMPLYAVLGGIGLLLFFAAEIPIAAVPAETYRIVTQPVLPSIPLFALAGTVLAAGAAPKKLMKLVQAWANWLPGGVAISTIVGCALFTAITGASGVTILALGALLLPVLLATQVKRSFSVGLITASGSVGLLFPPSLPVILYGVYAHVPIDRLFLAALVPGLLLIAVLTGFSIYRSGRDHLQYSRFEWRLALTATNEAKGYLLLPVLVILGLFGGFMTLVETAALTALWAILLEAVFSNNLSLRKQLPEAMTDAVVVVGALIAVMGLALGLVSYMVDAEIPQRTTVWVQNAIQSKLLFLLVLNGMLLLVGALMDIFSAIVVVVPLIAPIGLAFGIDPLHLGVIFLANLELGYLTPPVGMNLFISSLTFKRPLVEIWRTAVPFLAIFLAWVLLITYAPAVTVGVLRLLGL